MKNKVIIEQLDKAQKLITEALLLLNNEVVPAPKKAPKVPASMETPTRMDLLEVLSDYFTKVPADVLKSVGTLATEFETKENFISWFDALVNKSPALVSKKYDIDVGTLSPQHPMVKRYVRSAIFSEACAIRRNAK